MDEKSKSWTRLVMTDLFGRQCSVIAERFVHLGFIKGFRIFGSDCFITLTFVQEAPVATDEEERVWRRVRDCGITFALDDASAVSFEPGYATCILNSGKTVLIFYEETF